MASALLAQDNDGYIANPGPPPPEPNPLQIEVPRGEAVWITLSAYSLTSPILHFRIKRPPSVGKLGTPKLTSASTGVVRYQPPPGTGPGEDSFSYQVQSTAGFSASADVAIKITDKDPVLITPGDIEFGEVLVGQSVSRTLDMQNIGGGLADGEVQVPDGWAVQGDPGYHLTAGQKQTFTIVFTPQKLGACTGDVDYTGNPERATDLNGTCVPPVSVTTGTVELAQSGAMRAGMIVVKNWTATPQTLTLSAGPRLDVAQTAMAQANGTVEIEVRAKGDDAGFADQVTVEGAGTKTIVAVYAAAVAMDQVAVASTPAPAPKPPGATQAAIPVAPPAGTLEAGGVGLSMPGSAQTIPGMPVCSLGVGESTETSVQVGTNFKGVPAARSYRVETRGIKLDPQGNAVAQWTPFKDAALSVKGTVVIAQLNNLQPGSQYVVRLVGLDPHGNVLETSAAEGVRTAFEKKGWTWQWALLVAGVVAIAALAWRRRPGRDRMWQPTH